MVKVPIKPSIISAEPWLGLKVAITQSKRSALLSSSPSRDTTLLGWADIHVISRVNPLRILMSKPSSLNSRLANWAILLSQYDMTFVPKKAIEGQALADFLALIQFRRLQSYIWIFSRWSYRSQHDFKRWCMANVLWRCIKTASKGKIVAGVGVIFVSPENHVLPRTFSLTEPCSNNVTEYNALLIGLHLAQ